MKHTAHSNITFADVVHQSLSFTPSREDEALIVSLIDNRWVQRLRDISQTANTRLVYMFSEHSRFGHSLGVAYLAVLLMQKLEGGYPEEVESFRKGVAAAALLHDIGHLAPGSHTAYKTWFPDAPDEHEQVALRIIAGDPSLNGLLTRVDPKLPELVSQILSESAEIPPWTWEIISGGGWNVDRGNWCMVDSILAGVSYGKYNIPALIESIVITDDKHLALRENRLDAMMHFAVSRHAMYRQIYQHRVLLAADCLNKAIVMRARDLGDTLEFADQAMREVLRASGPEQLSLETIFQMREPWWRYHLMQWATGGDPVLADLSQRLLHRNLLKTVRIRHIDDASQMEQQMLESLRSHGFDPRYYFHRVTTQDVHAADFRQSMLVLMDDGRIRHLSDAEPLFTSLVKESKNSQRSWFVVPQEVKRSIGRTR